MKNSSAVGVFGDGVGDKLSKASGLSKMFRSEGLVLWTTQGQNGGLRASDRLDSLCNKGCVKFDALELLSQTL